MFIIKYIILKGKKRGKGRKKMARRVRLVLDQETIRKYNMINKRESCNRYLQRRLCELAGIECSISDNAKRIPKTKLRSKNGTTVYLSDDAERALCILQDKFALNFNKFARQEIAKRYEELFLYGNE